MNLLDEIIALEEQAETLLKIKNPSPLTKERISTLTYLIKELKEDLYFNEAEELPDW